MGGCGSKGLKLPPGIRRGLLRFRSTKRSPNPLGDRHSPPPGNRPNLLHLGVVQNDLKAFTHGDESNGYDA